MCKSDKIRIIGTGITIAVLVATLIARFTTLHLQAQNNSDEIVKLQDKYEILQEKTKQIDEIYFNQRNLYDKMGWTWIEGKE